MSTEQALNILKNLANLCVNKGNIFTSIDEVSAVNHALQVLQNETELKKAESNDSN